MAGLKDYNGSDHQYFRFAVDELPQRRNLIPQTTRRWNVTKMDRDVFLSVVELKNTAIPTLSDGAVDKRMAESVIAETMRVIREACTRNCWEIA